MFVDHGLYLETKRNIVVDQGLSMKNWETADVCQYWHGIMQWLVRECLSYLLGRRGSSLLSWLLVMFDNSRGGLNWGAEWSGETQVLVNVHEPSRSLCAMDTNAENDRKHTDYRQTSFRSLTFGPTTSAMPSSRATAAGMPGLQHAKFTELMNQHPSRKSL